MSRMRSPSYPSVSLNQAVDLVGKIHRTCRSNIITRENAVHEMGYSGLTGRSMKVLSALLQFGLLEKTGKGDVRVTQRAVEILHGIDPADRNEALLDAAWEPQLFREILDRFPDGIPSEGVIRSYLIQQDFMDVAIGPAITAFLETYRSVEHIRESESHVATAPSPSESTSLALRPDDNFMDHATQAPPQVGRTSPMSAQIEAAWRASGPVSRELIPNEIYLDFRGSREVHVEGLLDWNGIVELEEKLKAVKMILKRPVTGTSGVPGETPDPLPN